MYANQSMIDCQGISDNGRYVDLQLMMIMEMTMMRTPDILACNLSLCLSSVCVVALLLVIVHSSYSLYVHILTVEMSPLCAFALVVQISAVCLSPRKLSVRTLGMSSKGQGLCIFALTCPLSTLLSPLWATTLEGQGTKWKNNKLQSVKFYTDPPFKICLFSSYFLWTNLKNKQDEWFFMMLDHSLWIIVTRRIGQAFFVEFKHPPLGQDILAFKHSEHSVFLFYTVIQRDCNL